MPIGLDAQPGQSILIRGGTVVTADGESRHDVLIVGEKGGSSAKTVLTDDGAMPLLADAPMRNGEVHCSINHPHGQNVLFLGGNVRFCSHVNVGIDRNDIFVNDDGRVGAGLRRFDSVLGRPEERP